MGKNSKENILMDRSVSTDEKLEWLVNALTLEEKKNLISSASEGVERLDIPLCKLGGEAAHGVEARNDQNDIAVPDVTTSFPQPIGMASSWDKEAIRAAGEVTGKEARAEFYKRPWGGISRWAPTVDLLRDPRWGRNEESYSEDPVQTGIMAASYIRGIQGDDKEHLMAACTLKHFYANNTEIGRGWKNSSVSPRNKYELYFETFRRCIEDGGAEGVMTAYNKINGVHGLFNHEVKEILKDEFGLTHAVSDGGAMVLVAAHSHDTAMDAETVARSLKAGVDAMSDKTEDVYKAVCEAYDLGLINEEDLDTAIKNVFRTKIRLGLFDDEKRDAGEICSKDAEKICRTLTDKSVVLLKNDGVLPVNKDILPKGILIGPLGDKWYQDWYGGEAPAHISLYDGLKQSGIDYIDGCDRVTLRSGDKYLATDSDGRIRLSDEAERFILDDWGEESYTLRSEKTGMYMITKLSGAPVPGTETGDGKNPDRIIGEIYGNKDGIFSWFNLEVFRMNGKDDDIIMGDRFGNRLYADKDGYVVSAAGDYEGLTPLIIKKETVSHGIDEATEAAKGKDFCILALGHNPMINAKEEVDRTTIDFIPYQQKLFDEIYKVNKNIIVVLMSDYPFAINEINEKAKAILWSATGSQCMGTSIADTLTGDNHPAGRLTQTWYKSDKDIPDIDDYDIIGKDRTYRYFEGDVLYPFGYGLTYTDFKYDDLKVSVYENGDTAKKTAKNGIYENVRNENRVLKVEMTVTNTGDALSDEVVQIYAKAPRGRVKKPVNQLIGFERVRDIAPGETREIILEIPVRELAFYDVIRESLIIEDGDYVISANRSSRDEVKSQTVNIKGDKPVLRDVTKRIKADHYDTETGTCIVAGIYGYSAVTGAGYDVYKASADGHISVIYGNCKVDPEKNTFRIHCHADQESEIRIYIDDKKAGGLKFNTHDYDNNQKPVFNNMPRAVKDDEMRKESWPVLWADARIPVSLNDLSGDEGHDLRIECDGPVKFDWFMFI